MKAKLKLKLHIAGDRVYCGRPGCDTWIGGVTRSGLWSGVPLHWNVQDGATSPPSYPIYLAESNDGEEDRKVPARWHPVTLEDGTREWRRAGRGRRLHPAAYGVGPTWGVSVPAGDVVVCPNPKCGARQLIPIAPVSTPE